MSRAAELEYVSVQPIRRRKRIRRIILLIVVLAGVYPAYRWGPVAGRAAKMMYVQRRCLGYTAPEDQVVYEQDCPTTAALQNRPGYQTLPPVRIYSESDFVLSSSAAGWAPRELSSYSDYFPNGSFAGATLFMHERVSKTGVRRLVILQRPVVGNHYPFFHVFGIHVQLISPGTRNSQPSLLSSNRLPQTSIWLPPLVPPPTKGLRFYAGQVDPNDDARFTIRYELEGKSGMIDGRLNDAGDDVDLKVSSGPAMGTEWVTQVLP